VQPPVEEFILRALEKDPSRRFRDAFHFNAELRKVRERLGPSESWGGLNEEAPAAPGPRDTVREDDKVFENKGARVLVDPKSILYVSGSILEYSEGLMGSGFQIKNPNVKSSCGCGSSFNT